MHIIFQSTAVAAALLVSSSALATTGLQYKWSEGGEHRYVLSSQTVTSDLLWVIAQDNLERRIDEWRLNMLVTCKGDEVINKSVTRVVCTIDDLAIQARPFKADLEKTDQLMQEYDDKMTGAQVVIGWRTDGRFASFDLEEVKHDRSNDRTRRVQETMRLMIQRAFAGLEVQLPKKGDDKGRPWNLNDPSLYGFPTLVGTTGGLAGKGTVKEEKDGVILLELAGEGTRGPNIVDSRGRIKNLWAMRGFMEATFDPALGIITRSQAIAQGEITPSSLLASGGNVKPYTQAVSVERVAADAIADFGPTGLIPEAE